MHAGFYEAVAASAAAFFGIGAAVLTTRLVALMERAATLRVERGDLLNRLATPDGSNQENRWAERSRRDEIADIHVIARGVWGAIAWALVLAIVTIGVSLAALAEIGVSDSRGLRIFVLSLFLIASLLWLFLLASLSTSLMRKNEPIYRQQRREREASTAAGNDFLVSGDEEAFARTADEREDRLLNLIDPNPSLWRRVKRRARRVKRTLFPWRPPRV